MSTMSTDTALSEYNFNQEETIMKEIKRLGIHTKEGFEVRDLKRFPSMEWGDEGGLQADLYYNGLKILQVYQEGNGGCAITYLTEEGSIRLGEIRAKGLEFLKRVDKSYGPNTKYAWLKEKTVKNFDDDDWEAVVTNMEEYADDLNHAAQLFIKGAKSVVVCKNDWQTRYLSCGSVKAATENMDEFKGRVIVNAKVWLRKNYPNTEYTDFNVLLPVEGLHVL